MQARRHMRTGGRTVFPIPPVLTGRVYRAADYGVVADGTTDNRTALQNLFNTANSAGGGVIELPNGPVKIALNGANDGDGMWFYAGLSLRGSGPQSELIIVSSNTAFHPVINMAGGGSPHFEHFKITRGSDIYGTMFNVNPGTDIWFYDVVIDGNKDSYGTQSFSGMTISGVSGEVIDGLSIVRSTITGCDYGLFEGNNTAVTLQHVLVDGCSFYKNLGTDLEFNSPNGTCTDVTVTRSMFRDNLSSTTASGFGVGYANIQQIELSWCSFKGYWLNPVHFEDNSSNALVTRCWFENTSYANTGFAAQIIILGSNYRSSGSHDITITANRFDTTHQTNAIDCIYTGPGGATAQPPYNVSIFDNTFVLNSTVNASKILGNYGANNVTVGSNVTMSASP